MKIWGNEPSGPKFPAIQTNNNKKETSPSSSKPHDFQTIIRNVKLTPGASNDTVEEISKKYTSGDYNVDSRELANRILQTIRIRKSK